jgi:hypothetical protein
MDLGTPAGTSAMTRRVRAARDARHGWSATGRDSLIPKPLPQENPTDPAWSSTDVGSGIPSNFPPDLFEVPRKEAAMSQNIRDQRNPLQSPPKVSLLPTREANYDWAYSAPKERPLGPMTVSFREKAGTKPSPAPRPPADASSSDSSESETSPTQPPTTSTPSRRNRPKQTPTSESKKEPARQEKKKSPPTKMLPVKTLLEEETVEYPEEPGEVDPVDVPAQTTPRQASSAAGGPWTIPQPTFLENMGFQTGGWFQGGITFNRNATSNHFNGPLAINDRDSEFQMNQLWVFFDNPVDNQNCGVDLGGRLDMTYGTDWRYGLSHGLESNINSPNSLYGLCLPQIYGELAIHRWTLKAGHFATMFGKEQVPSVMNFFYSHDYLMSYSQPLLVTGFENTYAVTDQFDVRFGLHRGWYTFEDYDPNNEWNLFGGATLLSDEGRSRLRFDWDYGPQVAQLDQYRYNQALLWDWNISERLNHSIQYNWGTTHGLGTWYGIGDWVTYRFNQKWSGGVRLEWFHDGGGTRVGGIGNWLIFHGGDGSAGWTGSGYDGDFYEVTLGANWTPHPNLRFRPEVRWDWFRGAGRPFGNNDRVDTVTFAMDMLFTF